MAISMVSRSRISPTMITLGSCLRTARSPAANVNPVFDCTALWLTPCRRISTGSSRVTMFRQSLLSVWRMA